MTSVAGGKIVKMTNLTTKDEQTSILIVDDREENLLALEGWLTDFDLNIVKALSGDEALARMIEQDFALVLMDVQMPGMDGFEAAELMRGTERTRTVPIIFVTAISKEEKHIFRGYEAGAFDYIFKPFDPYILRSKVTVFVRLYQQNQELKKTVDELHRANEQIRHLYVRDALTKCFNRRYLNDRLPKEIKRTDRYGTTLSLIMTDIDHFKKVNDTYGHQCGDEVLKMFARTLRSTIRQDIDWISRYGGEEFVAVLPETNMAGAVTSAERMRKAVSETSIMYRNQALHINASFGVATLDANENESQKAAEKILREADERMYAAKKQGRNRVA
jgi:diguanylate cyclase (GGDEF)-like protein